MQQTLKCCKIDKFAEIILFQNPFCDNDEDK